jgi:glycosyltransferase involved in cell wall biosynthesis
MQSPTVLVVMPLYNAAKFVRKAVDSIFAQTYTDYQVLVVDDGSSDGSREMIRGSVGSKLALVRQTNRGPGVAMNRAIEYARERDIPFIARMDADDLSLPSRLEVQLQLLQKTPDAAACSANCYYMDAETEVITGVSTVPSRPRLIKWEIQNGLRGMVQGACVFRTDALVNVGGYRPQFQYAEETDLFLRLAEKFDLVNAKEYLYKIRIHKSSLSMRDVRKNVLHHYYALECFRYRRVGRLEESFEKFLERMDWKLSLRVRHEVFVLKLWRTAVTNHNTFSMLLASLIDPRRVLAHVLRKL